MAEVSSTAACPFTGPHTKLVNTSQFWELRLLVYRTKLVELAIVFQVRRVPLGDTEGFA